MSRLRHLGWNHQCSHGFTSRPLESCYHQCLKAVGGVLGALELLDGTPKLRHCTALFTMRFQTWSLPCIGSGGGKRQVIAPGDPPDAGSNVGKKGPAYPEDTSRSIFHVHSGSRASNAEEMEKIAPPPSSEGVGSEVGEPRNIFPRLGVG